MNHSIPDNEPNTEERWQEIVNHHVPQRLAQLKERTLDTTSIEQWLKQQTDDFTPASDQHEATPAPIRLFHRRYVAAAAIVFCLLGTGAILLYFNRPITPETHHQQPKSAINDWASIYSHSKDMQTHLVPASNMSEVNAFFQTQVPSLNDLPEVDHINDHRCCLITTDDGKVALIRVKSKYGPLTIAQAEQRQMNMPGVTRETTIAGRPATFSKTPEVNMLVIQVDGRYLCFMGQLTDAQLVEVATPFFTEQTPA